MAFQRKSTLISLLSWETQLDFFRIKACSHVKLLRPVFIPAFSCLMIALPSAARCSLDRFIWCTLAQSSKFRRLELIIGNRDIYSTRSWFEATLLVSTQRCLKPASGL